MAATGVSAARPCSINRATIAGSVFMPIRNTSVPGSIASFVQSRSVPGFEGSSWPVTTVTIEARVRCVTGMPA